MKLLFYGCLADMIGREAHVDSSGKSTIGELRRKLMTEHQSAREALEDGRVRACVADVFVNDDHVVDDDDVVEFLPPVSGG